MKRTERPRSRRCAHDREDALGEVGRQRRGDLVEQQQLRVARERAREVDHAQHRQRHVARRAPRSRRRGPSPRSSLRARRAASRRSGAGSARPSGRGRAPDPGRPARGRSVRPAPASRRVRSLPRDGDRPAVAPDHAGQHLDERALAGAVRAEQRVHLAGRDDEVGGAQRLHRPVALRDVARFEQWRRSSVMKRARERARRPLPRRSTLRPLAAEELLRCV